MPRAPGGKKVRANQVEQASNMPVTSNLWVRLITIIRINI